MSAGTRCLTKGDYACAAAQANAALRAVPGYGPALDLKQKAATGAEVAANNTAHADSLIRDAAACLQARNYKCAIAMSDAALTIVPKNVVAAQVRQQALKQQENIDSADDARPKRSNEEDRIVSDDKKNRKTLAAQPTVEQYKVSLDPGEVVRLGGSIKVKSQIAVVPGTGVSEFLIEERMTIYYNEFKGTPLRTVTRNINEKTQRGGRFINEFSFAFPQSLPDGVYFIGNELLVDGRVVQSTKSEVLVTGR